MRLIDVDSWYKAIMSQTKMPDEIIIVDSDSTDGTNCYLKKIQATNFRLKLITKRCKIAEGRNLAIKVARNEIIVSTDLGCTYTNEWLEELCMPFATSSLIDVVAGNYTVKHSLNSTVWNSADYYLHNGYRINYNESFLPSNRSIAFKKSIWITLGGYPEDLTFAGDDTVFSTLLRAKNYKIVFAKNSICFWSQPTSLKNFIRQAYKYSYGNGEANLFPPLNFSLNKKYRDYVLSLYCSIRTTKKSLHALKKNEILIALAIPIISYLMKIYSYKGFRDGFRNGLKYCGATRNILKNCLDSKK